MTNEKKIAWLTFGSIACGLWSANFIFIFLYAFVSGVFEESPDAIGVGLTLLIFLVFVLLPAFGTWKFFQAARHLSRERHDKFVEKEAFE